jgi:CubicO group peptidase (beta-lactamase class C family)
VTRPIRATKLPLGKSNPKYEPLFSNLLGAITSELVQERKIHWESQLKILLPPEIKLSDDAAKITLGQLATHTSGLPRQPYTERLLVYFIQYLFTGENFYRRLDEDAVFSYLSDFQAPSSRQPRYSNIGYGILGDVVERTTGRSLRQLLAERITGPLGLTHTGYSPEELPGWNERAFGHAGDQPKFVPRGRPVPDWRFTNILGGAAALYSTAHDLITYASAHLREDNTIQSVALKDTLRVRYPLTRGAAAINWIVDDVDGVNITYQVGNVAGYSSYVGVDVAHKTAVVVLQNAFNWDISIGHKLLLLLAAISNNSGSDGVE